MEKPLYKCMTKATNQETSEPQRSLNWALSHRGWFRIFADRIECGPWRIPFSTVRDAVLFRSRQSSISVSVLMVRAGTETYQFGFNPWAHPERYLAVVYREERVKLKLSPFSLALRAVGVLFLLYWFWMELHPAS
jgi:hypothetical protein